MLASTDGATRLANCCSPLHSVGKDHHFPPKSNQTYQTLPDNKWQSGPSSGRFSIANAGNHCPFHSHLFPLTAPGVIWLFHAEADLTSIEIRSPGITFTICICLDLKKITRTDGQPPNLTICRMQNHLQNTIQHLWQIIGNTQVRDGQNRGSNRIQKGATGIPQRDRSPETLRNIR